MRRPSCREIAHSSFLSTIANHGFKCEYDGDDSNTANNCILKGLGDYAKIRDIWKKHTKEAVEMFAEEEE